MRQLGELQKNAEKFEKLNAELIFIFREEREGIEGLQKIAKRFPTKFTLAVDLDKASSKAYSPRKMTFDNFVIDKQGKIAAVLDGTLKERATAEKLIEILEKLETARDTSK